MGIMLSPGGLKAEWRAELPFNNEIAVRLQWGKEDGSTAFDTTHNTHLWLLVRALLLLEDHPIARLIQSQPSDDFYDPLCQALWEADKKAPYNDPLFDLMPTMASHFYDPDTGKNWLRQSRPTALSEGCRFYRVSQRLYQLDHRRKAAYNLGLSLHYLTDLTQPMHAANFTVFDSRGFGYHTDFERYVKTMMHDIDMPTEYVPLIADRPKLESFFHAVARRSKDSYYTAICRPEWTRHFDEEAHQDFVWESRVGAVVPSVLCDAVLITAQFLRMWFEDVAQKI